MFRRTRSLSIAAAAIVAAALVVGVSAPAAAHTDDLFSIGWFDGDVGFISISKTDAAMSSLGAPPLIGVAGVEIVAEQGYAVGTVGPVVVNWNHDTGAVGTSMPITIDPAEFSGGDEVITTLGPFPSVTGLDSLPDGTLLTILSVESVSESTQYQVVVSLDPATGVATLLVDLTGISVDVSAFRSLATDPTTGSTYLFSEESDFPTVRVADLTTGTVGSPIQLAGVIGLFDDSEGFPLGADFDAAGTLWLVVGVNNLEEYHLLSFAAPFSAAATPSDVGELPYYEPGIEFGGSQSLAVDAAGATPEPEPDPAGLADTGSDPGTALLAAGALALLGLTVLGLSLARRKRTA